MNDANTELHTDVIHENKSGVAFSMWIALSVWFCMTVFLFAKLAIYSQSAGGQGVPPMAMVSGVHLEPGRHTLVVSIHPRCPCTQSTIYELERLVPKVNSEIDFVFDVYTTNESPESWFVDSSEQILARFPGAIIREDVDGKFADRIGALISGSTVLYDPNGVPVFWGGVTSGRGHSGDNLGSDSIVSIIHGRDPPRVNTPVYGCEIKENKSNEIIDSCCSVTSCENREPIEGGVP